VNIVTLSIFDLGFCAVLVLLLAGLSFQLRLGVGKSILVAALRTVIQLTLIGLVLRTVFAEVHLGWIALIALVMLLVAGREVMMRQHRRFKGLWGFGLGSLSMFVSTFSVTILVLVVVIGEDPWYSPQYAIPLLGMMFGNTMNGVALGVDRLTQMIWQNRNVVEARLMMGQNRREAVSDIYRESIRAGLIPIINAMAVAGVVSLPGMMTGQILAGISPMIAVNYQIIIMFMIAAGTGFGTIVAVTIGIRRLFDERERLRLDRLVLATQ
jgi:putative ABC transport system permease protein